ncbi:MAG: preprotein translocase subunit SecG [Candidatus Omnitrophica bacterium]|nr:preprotein translocase subunit SecG [Candidatus Omnitrophota bacterium]MBU4149957.1 preprotein translocase subunit SecG [Candidatus Omnitrophota bacterium]
MYAFFVTIHVIASLFLIAVILLQAGRGGGLSDTFGGSQMQNLFGTKSASVLSRLTAISATLFIITCLSLALISSRRNKSLVDKVKLPKAVQVPVSLPEEIPAPVAPVDIQGGADEAK